MSTIRKHRTSQTWRNYVSHKSLQLLVFIVAFVWVVATLRWWAQTAQPLIRVTGNHIVILHLNPDDEMPIQVRLNLYPDQTPKAAEYIQRLARQGETCRDCKLYRGEPVPSYWGSPEYPDRYFDGGRWGPPYALVQGNLVSDEPKAIAVPPPEPHRPEIKRGMVAWAGGKGGPHFFVALADHPEWKHGHTVFGFVDEQDMPKIDALLQRPLVETKPKKPPIVTNFVDPIPITMSIS